MVPRAIIDSNIAKAYAGGWPAPIRALTGIGEIWRASRYLSSQSVDIQLGHQMMLG